MPAQKTTPRTVRRQWHFRDPQTGVTHWGPGDIYTGPLDNPYLDDPSGPDGRGPLLNPIAGDEPDATPDAEKSDPAPSDSSVKEK